MIFFDSTLIDPIFDVESIGDGPRVPRTHLDVVFVSGVPEFFTNLPNSRRVLRYAFQCSVLIQSPAVGCALKWQGVLIEIWDGYEIPTPYACVTTC